MIVCPCASTSTLTAAEQRRHDRLIVKHNTLAYHGPNIKRVLTK